MELQYRPREDRIETAIRLPPSKRAIDASVVNLRTSVRIPFNRQFLPLTADVQQLQNVTKEGVQGELRRRAPASNAQVGQDKLPELLEAQFRRNALPLLTFRHFGPQVSRCCLDGSGSHLVNLNFAERTHTGTEQCDAGLPIHCALERFEPVDLPFSLTVAPRLDHSVAHRLYVDQQCPGEIHESWNAATFGSGEPGLKLCLITVS